MKRLETETPLRGYAGWFIPLKMETGSTEYRKWSRQYIHEGRAIPIVFVVRSDGKQLFGRSGPLPGLELYQLLEGVAPHAGRFFNARELKTIQAVVAQARVELDEEGPAAAIRTLRRLKRIGTLGELGGYAEASLAADRLVGEIETLGRTAISAINTRVESDDKSLDAALAMVEAKAAYGQLDSLNADLRRAQKKFTSDPARRKVLQQAELLDRLQRSTGRLVVARTRMMLTKYPEGEGLARALQTMKEQLARDPRTSDANTEFTWGSNDGRVVQATLVGFSRDATTDAMQSVTIQPAGRQASRVSWSRLDVVSHVMAKTIIAAREGKK